MEGERRRRREQLHSISFLFETCFVPEQTAEGNVSTAPVSEGRRLFKLKSGLINASDYFSGKGQRSTKRRKHSPTRTGVLLGASINMRTSKERQTERGSTHSTVFKTAFVNRENYWGGNARALHAIHPL